MSIERIELTGLQYSTDVREPLRLYIYEADSGYHGGAVWFRRKVKYSGEEITTREAKAGVDAAMLAGREVRITNGADDLVFHAMAGQVLYPADPEAFWRAVLG